jgi:Spy/CpxP family protein refolding chaperone
MEIILKNLLSVALLAVLLPTVAVAGNNKSNDPDQRVEQLTKKLDLTSEQQEKARAILMDAQTKNEALAKKYKLDAYKAETQELNDASQKAISDMLTPEQRQKFETMKKSKKQKKK